MDLLTIVRVVGVVSAGLLAGIFLGHRAGLHYAVPQLSASSFVQLGQIIHAHYVRFMPPLVLTALASSALWLAMVRAQWRTAEFWLVAISACAMLAILAATRAVNVPLNNQLMTWSVASPPPDLQELWAPWERVNTLRSVLATGALVLEAVALSLKAAAGR
ncbi:MAG TPA: DUF1772 domain-containing protein [Ktedonobacterales bacterium]|nr:DUF1772 domain-containing protein [Ktedonobacterales bacterium]